MKILKTTKLYNNRIYLPNEIREILGDVSNGEVIIFGLNDNQEIVLFKNKKHDNRFNVKTSTNSGTQRPHFL